MNVSPFMSELLASNSPLPFIAIKGTELLLVFEYRYVEKERAEDRLLFHCQEAMIQIW